MESESAGRTAACETSPMESIETSVSAVVSNEASFSFEELHRRLSEVRERVFATEPLALNNKLAWAMLLVGGLSSFSAVHFLAGTLAAYVSVAGLAVEFTGLFFLAWRTIRHRKKNVGASKSSLVELDQLYEGDRTVYDWLATFDPAMLRDRMTHLKRYNAANDRTALVFFGPAEKLGALPVLALLYLQARSLDWHKPSLSETVLYILLALIAGLYILSWSVLIERVRADRLYVVLESSLANR
jgi:hypothetical protein